MKIMIPSVKMNSEKEVYISRMELLLHNELYGWMISYFNNPTEEMQLAAIKSNPINIKLIENPTEKVKLLALEMILSK